MKWTTDQQSIIDYSENKDLLVSAAAGSGKTAVMTERVHKRSIDGTSDISRMLIMTFTDLAAQSMRDRIERSFRSALEENIAKNGSLQEREVINQQIMLLQQAQISTIHSFCWQVIQAWSSELVDSNGEPFLDTGLGVLDETRKKILLEQATDEVLNFLYNMLSDFQDTSASPDANSYADFVSGEIPVFNALPELFCLSGVSTTKASWLDDFARLVDSIAGRRDDNELRAMLMQSLDKIRSLADYEQWCRDRLDEYWAKGLSFADSTEYKELLSRLEQLLVKAEDGLEELQHLPLYDRLITAQLTGKEEPRFKECLVSQLDGIVKLRLIIDDADPNKWDRIFELAQNIDTSYLLPKRGDEKKEFMSLYNTKISPLMSYLTGNPTEDKLEDYFIELPIHAFSAPISSIEQDINSVHGVLSRFCEIAIMIDRAYMRLKLEDKAVDFSDFEHFALRLLRIPTVRESYMERFSEIYLDEYQDTNNIQETIIRQIANNNVFMVGDIKQSIYRFRHANPSLFVDKADRFEKDPMAGCLLRLNRNFRSVPGIIDGINKFFDSFLTKESGEIDYRDGHQLTAGVADERDARVRLMIVNVKENKLSGSNTADDILEDNSSAKESLAVIKEIKSLVASGEYGYGDFAILARTRAVCQIYYKQLSDYGIPVTSSGEREFLDSPELRLMEALINLLDNMQQDIPMAAIMRSALVNDAFTEEELMMIRSEDKLEPSQPDEDRHFYASVLRYREKGSNQFLRQRVDEFLRKVECWRDYEKFMSISELIGHIYEESSLIERVSTLNHGAQRAKDLELFREWADSFERSRQRGLYSFALYIRKIREKKLNDKGFDTMISVENAVQIMTIHGSKGLEFPVVFIAGAGKSIDVNSDLSPISISEHGGITGFSMNPDRSERHMTTLHYSHLLNSIRADRAESYRLLYVAMTRAEKLLYIAANVNVNAESKASSKTKLQSLLEGYIASGMPVPIPSHVSASAKTWLQLFLLFMISEPQLDPLSWFMSEGIESGYMKQGNDNFILEWYESDWLRTRVYPDYTQIITSAAEDTCTASTELIDQNLVESWSRRLFQEYPYSASQKQPAKLTVTGLKRLQEQLLTIDEEIADNKTEVEENLFKVSKATEMAMTFNKPNEGKKKGRRIAGAELGSLLHSLFQFVDLIELNADADETEARRQIEQMAANRVIYPRNLSQALEWSEALVKFARSELAASIRAHETQGKQVYREMPFTIAVKADDNTKLLASKAQESSSSLGDFTLVQGMIDCWYADDQGITLVDFKSDYLDCSPVEFTEELSKRYKLQLDYYAEAVSRATGVKSIRRIIWLIRYAQAVEI